MSNNRKPALYYVIRHGRIIAVTSETPNRWHGRLLPYNETTHGCRDRSLIGRFPSEEAARDLLARIVAIQAKFRPLHEKAQIVSAQLRKDEQREIDALTAKP